MKWSLILNVFLIVGITQLSLAGFNEDVAFHISLNHQGLSVFKAKASVEAIEESLEEQEAPCDTVFYLDKILVPVYGVIRFSVLQFVQSDHCLDYLLTYISLFVTGPPQI